MDSAADSLRHGDLDTGSPLGVVVKTGMTETK